MSSTRTLLEMRNRARQLSDMVGSTFITDDELTDIVNSHCQGLYDLLIEVRGQAYYALEKSIPTKVGKSEYNLPDEFYQLSGAPILYDGNHYHQLRTWEENERARLLNLSNSTCVRDCRYRLVAGKVVILPAPNTAAWTLKLRYVPTFTKLVDDSEVFDGINGWERWVELNSAIDMLAKEESDFTARAAQLQQVEARIRKLGPSRDAANPPRIVDTRGDWAMGDDFLNDWDA